MYGSANQGPSAQLVLHVVLVHAVEDGFPVLRLAGAPVLHPVPHHVVFVCYGLNTACLISVVGWAI